MPRFGAAVNLPQVSDPASPTSGRQFLYFKSDGILYTKKSDGSVVAIGVSPSNMVTTNTDQIISSGKAFTRQDAATSESNFPSYAIQFVTSRWNGAADVNDSGELWLDRYGGSNPGEHALKWQSPGGFAALGEGAVNLATAINRWIGGTTSGAPAAGAQPYKTGDWVVSRDGKIYICTAGGSPGTWVNSGAIAFGSVVAETAWNLPAENGSNVTAARSDHSHGTQPMVCEPYVLSVTGPLTVMTGKSRIYFEADYVVETIRAAINTAPTGASVIVDVNKNGTTLFTTQSNRPTISASGFLSTVTAPAVTTFTSGDYLTVDVDQIGSTIAGADLTVTIRLRRT